MRAVALRQGLGRGEPPFRRAPGAHEGLDGAPAAVVGQGPHVAVGRADVRVAEHVADHGDRGPALPERYLPPMRTSRMLRHASHGPWGERGRHLPMDALEQGLRPGKLLPMEVQMLTKPKCNLQPGTNLPQDVTQ